MKRITLVFVFLIATIVLSGCALFETDQPTPTEPAGFIMMVPTSSTPQNLPTVTPQPTAILLPTPIAPIPAMADVEGLALREGPGKLFDILNTYAEYTEFTVLGKAPGGQWYLVVMPNSLSGWMFAEFVTLQGDADNLPYFNVINADVIYGRVSTSDGTPASGIGVSLAQANQDIGQSYDATMTDVSGAYYLYLPEGTRGEYIVGINAYNCVGNLIVGECDLPYVLPGVQSFSLPGDLGMAFDFILNHK